MCWPDLLSVVNVDQFYGIELGEFPVRIAEVALWMMDHIMNNRLSLEFGETYVRIPLKTSPHIVHGDALEMDWAEVLPPEDCSYVLGNPPFGGAKFQSAEQRAQVRRIAALGKSGGTLDYVTAWFIQAGEYVQESCGADRLRGHQFHYAGRAGGAALADPVWPLRTGDRVRAPDIRLGFGRTRHGACACGDYRIGEAGRCAQREAAFFLRRPEGRAPREQACGAVAVFVRCGWVGGSEGGGTVGIPAG